MSNNYIYSEVLEVRGVGANAHYLINPKTVYDFFTMGALSREIPKYQRPYSWAKDNISELLFDIKNAYYESKGWFLGPVFTTQEPNSQYGISYLLDGQQRTTTIQLILIEAYLIQYSFETPLDKNVVKHLDELNNQIEYTLKKNQSGTWNPLFTPDPSIKEVFVEYWENCFKTSSHKEWKNNHVQISTKSKHNWLKGYSTFKIAVDTIRQELIALISNTNKPTEPSIIEFCEIIKQLLYKCWLIEIPLQKEEYVLDIFESLNNRGKPLSLTDIIKFKSLTIGKSNQKISDLWAKIFEKLDKLENLDLVSDEDDFFKYLLNTYSKIDLTDNKALIDIFTITLCKSESDVIDFLETTYRLCSFLEDLYDLDQPNNQITSRIQSQRQLKRLKVLVALFMFAKKCTDNVRFLLFYFGRKENTSSLNISLLEIYLLNLSKSVLFNVIFSNKKSNTIRNDFLSLINDFEDKITDYDSFIVYKNWNELTNQTYNYNLLHINEPQNANFVLVFNQVFSDNPSILINYSNAQYKKAQSEHLFPIKWQDKWSNKLYSKIDVDKFCDSLKGSIFSNKIKYKNFDDLLSKINLNVIELNSSNTKRASNENTLIEFIGNKWLLNNGLNNKQKNMAFVDKLQIIQRSNGLLMVPTSDNNLIGVNQYVDFTFKDIIERSILILDMIVLNYTKSIDDII